MPFYSVTKYRLHPAHADYTVCPTRSPSLDKAPGAGTRNFIYIDIYTHRYIYIHKKKKKKSSHAAHSLKLCIGNSHGQYLNAFWQVSSHLSTREDIWTLKLDLYNVLHYKKEQASIIFHLACLLLYLCCCSLAPGISQTPPAQAQEMPTATQLSRWGIFNSDHSYFLALLWKMTRLISNHTNNYIEEGGVGGSDTQDNWTNPPRLLLTLQHTRMSSAARPAEQQPPHIPIPI